MSKSTFIHVICDYGLGDPAFGEVLQRLHGFVGDLGATLYPTSVDFSDTLGGGFWLAQYLIGQSSEQKVLAFSNIAPRKEQSAAMKNNSGEGLKYARLKNGAEAVAINGPYIFSFLKPYLEELREVVVSNEGTQFRSRDNYPRILGAVARGDYSVLGDKVDLDLVPDVPANVLAWTDGYGNLKTTIRHNAVKALGIEAGQKVKITMNNIIWEAIYADGSFSVRQGEIAFAPGSSGGNNGDNFMEIFLRRSTQLDIGAADVFRKPHNGCEIKFEAEK